MKFNILYVDCPWEYDRKVGGGVAADHYPTLNIAELRKLPIQEIADSDCVLFLWATFPMLKEALSLFDSWGFKYRTCAFNWVKRNKKNDDFYFGLGFWTRTCSEVCLLGTRGHPQRVSKKVRQVCDARITYHSHKPDEIRDRIVELCGDLPRIELFARQETEGWIALGNEIDGLDIRDALKIVIEKKEGEQYEPGYKGAGDIQ